MGAAGTRFKSDLRCAVGERKKILSIPVLGRSLERYRQGPGMKDSIDAGTDARRVLLVEDSSVTKDLVELVLTQAGHRVTSVGDGGAALEALLRESFDVVLTDFHLPDITGLEVVQRFVAVLGDRPRPVFVAITGDTRGLLADRENCEVFDRVVPKPLDIDLVCDLVAEPAPARQSRAVAAVPAGRATADGLGLALMEWPPGPGPAPAPGLAGIDAILVREARNLTGLWQTRGANLLPVLDETGKLGASADVDMTAVAFQDIDRGRQLVDLFHDRKSELHPDLLRSDDPADRLLTRVHVSGGTLTARRSHRHDGLVAWNTICDPDGVPALIDRLVADGLVQAAFFERVHVCPSCRSARTIVREECPSCRSAELTEESYLHHFRCATQGPESDFVVGDELICPKCRRHLLHFGRDYDRPGVSTRCESCRATTTEPQIAFVCTHCGDRTPGEAMPTQDVHSTSLTEAGKTYLRNGATFLGPGRRALRFGDFPLDLVIALNQAAAAYNASQVPFTLASISYEGLGEVRSTHGARHARDSRRLWLESLKQALGDKAIIARGDAGDFALLPNVAADDARSMIDRAVELADRATRDDVGAAVRLFGPEDIAA